jgi:hypothetical protein
MERPKQRKMDMRFGALNIRSLYRARLLTTVARKIAKCKLDVRGVALNQQAIVHIFCGNWNEIHDI